MEILGAIKITFGSLIITLIGVLITGVVYIGVWRFFNLYIKATEFYYTFILIRPLQLWLNSTKNKYAQKSSNWVWKKLNISYGFTRLRRLAIYSSNDDNRLWAIRQMPCKFINIKLFYQSKLRSYFRDFLSAYVIIGSQIYTSKTIKIAMEEAKQKIEKILDV